MADLSRFVHYACGFVDFENATKEDIPNLLGDFVNWCESYNKITKYYLVAHDDTNIIHIHFCLYSVSQVQLMTYLNKMRNYFVDKKKHCRSVEGISIEKCENINAMLLYFLHQDKKSIASGKKQYSLDDFVSNEELENIDTLIHSKKGVIDAYYLRDAVLDNINDFELMAFLGLNIFHRYRYEIEIIKENRSLLALQRQKEKDEKLEKELPF